VLLHNFGIVKGLMTRQNPMRHGSAVGNRTIYDMITGGRPDRAGDARRLS